MLHLTNQSILVILIVGIVAGFLAGKVVRGFGFGLIGDLAVGIIGAFVGDWILPKLNLHLGTGMVGEIVNATLGAIVFLLMIGLFSGRRGLGRRR